mmetsp:Transcript_32467/g.39903  ORF Transcript_32467/g.39903 Transcript_32467/m.39903 type:complete len:365 (-) Transcript_32467:316-1410(-)|eukprot:CAMPEP_0172484332 /NCGR_PEP_ID=MMETSP1066-20121228/11752_1 /TAXON_ID=671091 /ORGANISM="Coscinodiscus wailesii, Strain CCMP2513" /LENGTH=364 /DNA_ID=CAMNT_0013248773 /DNA_START=129 /DNA_END=1223 /DNA_ORIENTATION=+
MTDAQETTSLSTEIPVKKAASRSDEQSENKTEEKKDCPGDSTKGDSGSADNSENHKPNKTKSCDDESSPTPAETAKQQSGKKSGKARNRGKRNQGKKGSWKKLDVDISFNKEHNALGTPNTSASSRKQKPHAGGDREISSSSNPSPAAAIESPSSPNPQSHQPKSHRSQAKKSNNSSANSLNWRERKKDTKIKESSQPWFPSLSEEAISKVKPEAAKQVEYFFTDDELCRNTFLRWNMDCEGYIPAAIVFNFPSVVRYGLPYHELLDSIKLSKMLEVDTANETIRIRGEYKKWLYPNQEGGLGCPRWIKQPEQLEQQQDGTAGAEDDNTKTKAKDDTTISTHTTPELVHCTDSESEHTEGVECT